MPGTASEIVNLRAVGYGDVPKPELPVGELGAEDASGAVVDEHDVIFDGERVATKIYDRAKLAAGRRLRRAGDRDGVRLDHGRPAGPSRATVDADFNILINPND